MSKSTISSSATNANRLQKAVVESELRDRISNLEAQLRLAKADLNNIATSGDIPPPPPPPSPPKKKSPSFLPSNDQPSTENEDKFLVGHNHHHRLSTTTILSKSGYLFKWLDRSIGWGGTKWALRFVTLSNGTLSYYGSHSDEQPRYFITLRGCAVRDDGCKRNTRHKYKKNETSPPPIDEVGAYFHVFSIYQRPDTFLRNNSNDPYSSDEDDDRSTLTTETNLDEIVPLLRFSTPSLGEKMSWIQVISESCAYCDTEEFVEEERLRQIEIEKQKQEQLSIEKTKLPVEFEALMEQQKKQQRRGTLPPLYFVPDIVQKSPSLSNLKNRKQQYPSGSNIATLAATGGGGSGTMYRTKSGDLNAAKSNQQKTSNYPPSKPMHRSSEPSYLSEGSNMQNYRGFFNLAMIILVVSNFRLIVDTISSHGFVLQQILIADYELLSTRASTMITDDETLVFIFGFGLLQFFIVNTYVLEKLLSKKMMPNKVGSVIQYTSCHLCLLVETYIVWNFMANTPLLSSILLFHSTITWMKLLSYIHANEDYRTTYFADYYHNIVINNSSSNNIAGDNTAINSQRSGDSTEQQHGGTFYHDTHQATLALIDDLDPIEKFITYPKNVKLSNIYYFWFAPTLTYQIAFPRTTKIRWWRVIGILARLLISSSLFLFLIAQVINPNINCLVKDLEKTNGKYTVAILAEYGLKLSIGNTYSWLLVFYIYFHLYLNLWAELLRFGDRVFYKDWWNSSEVSAYWRLWNMPVHYWLVRHIYFPCVRVGLSKFMGTFMVFFISAVVHELLISVPFHIIRPWSFIGMMMQMPLVAITKFLYRKRLGGSSIGNIIFWICFCVVGQPMAILLYTADYQYSHITAEEVVDYNSDNSEGGQNVFAKFLKKIFAGSHTNGDHEL